MLTFFRRIINSKLGIVIAFLVIGAAGLAFAMNDVTGLGHSGVSGPGGDSVATVGDTKISTLTLRERAQDELVGFRQEQPGLDMVQFIAGGGLDGSLDRIVQGLAFEQYGHAQGMIVSDRLIQGKIASIPSLQGPDGKFSQKLFDETLTARRLTYSKLLQEMTRDEMSQLMLAVGRNARQVPAGVALPYASLLLEKRDGQVAVIPTQAMGPGAEPTEAEVATYYKRNIARYTVAERRVIRYAIVSPDHVKAAATPTDAEVAQVYQAQRADYAPTEKRTVVQVVLADQAAANALLAKVKAGTPIDVAARASGLEPATFTGVQKAALATQSAPDVANAAFAATKGSLLGPIRTALGYAVVRVESIEQVAGKSLEQAKPEIVKALTAQKTTDALSKVHDAIDDAITDKGIFDDLVKDQKLAAVTSPPLLSNGANPDDPTMKPDPALGQVITAGFGAEQGDSPQIVPIGQDGSFAVVALGRIVPAAPRALATVHDGVARDFRIDRAQRAAHQVAATITEAVNKGTPLAQALAATKLPLPPVKPLSLSRQQLPAQGTPPPITLMFSMAEGKAKLLAAPNNGGWFVVYLNKIERGDASNQANLVQATRSDLGQLVGREYAEQFAKAVRNTVGVKKNEAAVAKVKAELLGQGGSDQP